MRIVEPPAWLMVMPKGRQVESESEWVKETQWVGLHPHAFRHLVATMLDSAGLSAREIADYLGHERVSMT